MSVIICAVDLQDTAHPVITTAASLARLLEVPLELMHVVHVPPGLPLEYMPEEVIAGIRKRASDLLERQVRDLRKVGVDVSSSVALGLVDDCIIKRAREANAQLLVLGTHARRGPAHLLLGSVAERAVRSAPCPALIVPHAAAGRLARGEAIAGPLKIVAGIDASPASDAALAWLHALDTRRYCDLGLVHLYSPSRECERLGLIPPDPFEFDAGVVAVLKRDLQARVAEHFGRRAVPVTARPFWGAEEDLLTWEADTDAADLVVVGTSQRRHSIALETVRGAHRPVLCVPAPGRPSQPRAGAPLRTVLVTTDFSPLGNAAVEEAYRLLQPAGGQVILLHVAEQGSLGVGAERRNELEAQLLALVPAGVELRGVRTRAAVVADAAPAHAILQSIRREAPDIVVMSSHGRSGMERAVRGSVAEDVLRASPKPVLVVPSTSA